MPGPAPKVVADEDGLDEDRGRDGDIGGDGADGEDGADGDAAEHQEVEREAQDRVEPNRVDGGARVPVDPLEDAAQHAEAVVPRVGEADAARGHHAAGPHHERADDCEAQNGEGHWLRQYLHQVCRPGLAL